MHVTHEGMVSISLALALCVGCHQGNTATAFLPGTRRHKMSPHFFKAGKFINEGSGNMLFSSSNGNDDDEEPRRVVFNGSLELLAFAVSLFFIATVTTIGADNLFATPQTLPESSRVTIDADAVLRDDFERSSSSVQF